MASSSRPFQSQTINRLLGTYYQWSQKLSQGIRWLQVKAVWAIQVALYPGYAAFQATRVVYRKIAAADPVGQLANLRKSESLPIKTWLSPNQSDGTIKLFLGWLVQPSNPVFEGYLPQVSLPGLALAAQKIECLVPSNPSQLFKRSGLQGVATDLETHTLILVANGNQLLNVLSPEEQTILARVISWLLAEQGYDRWRHKQQLMAGKLPLLSPNRRSWWPIQLFQHLMRWMSMTPVAKMTNLFGEVELAEELKIRRLLRHQAKLYLSQADPADSLTTPLLGPFSLQVAPPQSLAQRPATAIEPTATKSTAIIAHNEPSFSGQAIEVTEVKPVTLSEQPSTDDLPWIEAKAVVVSYVDHPLVTVLWWIDRSLTQLEALIQSAWNWVRSHITF
ncbi:MAG TPA: hypothetical protein V6D29_01545 [Leptolyngbyaceae cyanobacterium]